jgi:signal transduction histidine kinase
MLRDFLVDHRAEILSRCGERRATSFAGSAELTGVPLFLEQLVEALGDKPPQNRQIEEAAASHGSALLSNGCSVAQVVHSYGNLCQSIADLAAELHAKVEIEELRILNRCLDDAIASAVTEHARQGEIALLSDETARGTQRLGVLAHELRNLANNALLAFEVLKTSTVGVDGSTSALLGRSLTRLRNLANRSLGDVRVVAGIKHAERIPLAEFLEEVATAASLEAKERGVQLTVVSEEGALEAEADPQVLASVVGNLLQNAIKFTRIYGSVVLRQHATTDRIFIEVADECGGIREAEVEQLFDAYEQKHSDRSGLGLGLTISLQGARAYGGDIKVRNIPGTGCVFTVNLPRARPSPGADCCVTPSRRLAAAEHTSTDATVTQRLKDASQLVPSMSRKLQKLT